MLRLKREYSWRTEIIALTGKIVLVTGGTSGIGYALAQQFCAAGARVVVCGRSQERLEATRKSLPNIIGLQCDVTDIEQVCRMVSEIDTRFGRLDILVSNAGSLSARDFTGAVDLAEIEIEVRLNLTAPINLTALAMPLLRKADRAAIVMVTSGYAVAPSTHAPVYSASKAGLRAFTKALRRQVKPLGMTVTEVIPPVVDTPAVAHRAVKKVSPQQVAVATLRAVSSGRPEVFIGATRLLPMMMRLMPGLTENMVAKS
jgi:uncharacterized oxidoreductase